MLLNEEWVQLCELGFLQLYNSTSSLKLNDYFRDKSIEATLPGYDFSCIHAAFLFLRFHLIVINSIKGIRISNGKETMK